MLQNAYLFAKIGADTAENEQNLPKFCDEAVEEVRRGGPVAEAEVAAEVARDAEEARDLRGTERERRS